MKTIMSDCSASMPSYTERNTPVNLTVVFADGKTYAFNVRYETLTVRGRHQSLNSPSGENCYSEYGGRVNCYLREVNGVYTFDRAKIRTTRFESFHDPHHHCGEVCSQLSSHIRSVRKSVTRTFANVVVEDLEALASFLFESLPEVVRVEVAAPYSRTFLREKMPKEFELLAHRSGDDGLIVPLHEFQNGDGSDLDDDLTTADFRADAAETEKRALPARFRAEEGIRSDWSGTWTRIEGRRYKVELKKGNETLTAEIVNLGYGYLPAEGSSTATVLGLGGQRVNSSDGNNGQYTLRPKGPGTWGGVFEGPRGRGRVWVTEE